MIARDNPRRRERVLAKWIPDTWVLLNLDDGEYYALNEVGGRVWDLCDGTRDVPEVVRIISAEYQAPPETIEADVIELLGELARAKLLVETNRKGESPAGTAQA